MIPTSGNKRSHTNQDQLFEFYSPSPAKKQIKSIASPATRLAGISISAIDGSSFTSNTLGLISLNAAPDTEQYAPVVNTAAPTGFHPLKKHFGPFPKASQKIGMDTSADNLEEYHEPAKKKYAKEAWPGRKPQPNL